MTGFGRWVPLSRTVAAVAAAIVMNACADRPTGPTSPATAFASTSSAVPEDNVSICHFSDASAHIITVAAPALGAHARHDDYVSELVVDRQFIDVEDGIHFRRIGDAIAAARATRLAHGELESGGCRITIDVAPGVYDGSATPDADPTGETFPLVLDVPDVTVRGSYVMPLDERGRATDVAAGADATVLAPSSPLPFTNGLSTPLFVVNGHPVGSKGNGVVIEGFVLRSGHTGIGDDGGGQGVLALRARDLVLRGNRFEQGFTESIDLRATSATVEHNHLGGGAGTCDMCLAGPGDYVAQGNRLRAGGIPGILIVPATLIAVPPMVEQYELPAASTVTVAALNNEVRDHLRLPVGAGLRVGGIGVGAPNVAGTAHVVARDNTLVHNRFNMIVEAAFPVATGSLRGDIDLRLSGNTLAESCQSNLLVSFSRHTTALGLTNLPYLRNSTFTLSLGGDVSWEDAWYGHPSGFGNTLMVDGVTMPNGVKHAYDAAKTCS